MEQNIPLTTFGECFKKIRNEKGLTQTEIYEKLYPGEDRGADNIKKYIGKIEHGKAKTLNADLVIRFCKRFNVSADYLLGIQKDFESHELEFVCNYTGLDKEAVKQLHEWNEDKNNGSDITKVDEAFFAEDEKEHLMIYAKQTGIAFLRIVNYLFKSGTRKSSRKRAKSEPYSNLSILYSLYLLSMARPKEVHASLSYDDYTEYVLKENPTLRNCLNNTTIDLSKPMYLYDNNHVLYLLDPKTILETIGKKQLNNGVEWLIEQVNREDSNSKD